MNMSAIPFRMRSFMGVVTITLAMLFPTEPAIAAQVSGDVAPVLTAATATTVQPGTIVVAGKGFTPGGRVFIALYDGWGEQLLETRWVMASETVSGPIGSLDPATMYVAGGVVFESYSDPCYHPVMVRAYDQATDSWSNVLDVVSGCQK
jgi:hypothetical protein